MAEAIIFNPVYSDLSMVNDPAGIPLTSADTALFENVFKIHFKNLHTYAITIIRNEAAAEEIVQNVFFRLWERRDTISIEKSVASYLYRCVYNESLNYIKHTKVKDRHRTQALHLGQDASATDSLIIKELRLKIDSSLNELPEQCRTVFQMSRFEGLKYKDIAVRLGISVKTVENQMGKALRVLRTKLVEYLPAIMVALINIKKLIA